MSWTEEPEFCSTEREGKGEDRRAKSEGRKKAEIRERKDKSKQGDPRRFRLTADEKARSGTARLRALVTETCNPQFRAGARDPHALQAAFWLKTRWFSARALMGSFS
jgi:hypothetical protein